MISPDLPAIKNIRIGHKFLMNFIEFSPLANRRSSLPWLARLFEAHSKYMETPKNYGECKRDEWPVYRPMTKANVAT
jgi:hypothetical protein